MDPLNASVTATPAAGGPSADQPHAGHIVGRGMLALVFSQLITTPISIVVNALLARTLGASDFGAIYFAITALGVWYLFVEWGGHALVCRGDRPRSSGGGPVPRIRAWSCEWRLPASC